MSLQASTPNISRPSLSFSPAPSAPSRGTCHLDALVPISIYSLLHIHNFRLETIRYLAGLRPFLRLPVSRLWSHPLSTPRGWKSRPDRGNHFAEPPEVQRIQNKIRSEVYCWQPQRQITISHEGLLLRGLVVVQADVTTGFALDLANVAKSPNTHSMAGSIGRIHIGKGVVRAVRAPAYPAEEEGRGQESAVHGLVDGACQVELVAEPVDIQERTRQLVQQEDWTIEVYEGPLRTTLARMPRHHTARHSHSPARIR